MSTNKEIKLDEKIVATDQVVDLKVPASGVDADLLVGDAVVPDTTESVVPISTATPNKFTPGRKMRGDAPRHGSHNGQNRGGKRGEPRERVKPEFDSKIIDIRRVTRVATGGRRYTFSVAVVAGDHNGRVGVGLGKGGDTALSVEKATRDAKKNLIKVVLNPKMVIPHAVEGKYSSAVVKIFPARGRGVIAGSSARAVIELAGIKDVCAKFISGTKNRLNNAKATIEALKNLNKLSRSVLRGGAPKK